MARGGKVHHLVAFVPAREKLRRLLAPSQAQNFLNLADPADVGFKLDVLLERLDGGEATLLLHLGDIVGELGGLG